MFASARLFLLVFELRRRAALAWIAFEKDRLQHEAAAWEQRQPYSLEGEAMGVTDTVKDAVKDIVTGLTTRGNAELGAGLLEAAQAENRKALQSAVVGRVQEILVHISKQRDYIAQSEANVVLLEGKIRAIEAGEFTVSTYGVLTFHDEALQKGVVRMAECTNCGYGARRDIDSAPARRG